MNAKRHTVLLVDDEPDILDALFDTFIERYNVLRAGSVAAALDILADHEVDLIISDQRMPEVTGVELFSEVNRRYPHVGKVLLTGYSDIDAVVNAINNGNIDKYVTKPWYDKEVMHIVLEVINKRLKKSLEERKRLESQLMQNAKLASLGELVAGIAHELNNPLGFINANLGNLHKFTRKIIDLIEAFNRIEIPERTKAQLERQKIDIHYDYVKNRIEEIIARSKLGAERMSKIIMDLKTFSRLDSADFADTDINEEIDTTLNLMVNEYKYNITITKEYGELPHIKCNTAKINQVLMNILINACQAIEGKGEIRIKTLHENGTIRVHINDTGRGIPKNVQDRIFNPFFTTKPAGQGTGLGLSISHRIVKQHQGELSVKSEVGNGTSFTIRLPINQESEKT